MMGLLTASAAIFTYVAAKAFQQRNVVGDHYLSIMPVSIVMALMEFYVVGFIAVTGFSLFKGIVLGLAGGSGCILSMLMHKRIFSEKAKPAPADKGLRQFTWGIDRDGGKYPIYAIRTGSRIHVGPPDTPPDTPPLQRAVESVLIKRGLESMRDA